MRANKLLIIISVVLLGILFWLELPSIYFTPQNVSQVQNQISNYLVKDLRQQSELVTPSPLRIKQEENPQSTLTREGVIKWTNIQRKKYGLPLLKENQKLDSSSEVKVDDMFVHQYFAHKSPQGLSVGDLTKKEGYDFIEVGENLALGNFKDDEDLVNAWMNSPGHRANILNPKYQDIGVSVEKGTFEGKTTWMAVQHFGFPLSACPFPNSDLKKSIDNLEKQINNLTIELNEAKEDIENTKFKYGPLYLKKINYYNSLVAQYNNLVEESKILIRKYNNQVKSFNSCAEVSPS